MNEFFHSQRNGSSCRRKKVSILDTKSLFQQTVNRLLIKLILHVKQGRRCLPIHQIGNVMLLTHFQSIQHQPSLQSRCFIDFCLDSSIHFFPKTRNTTHSGRTDFLDGLLYILRTQVDTQSTSFIDAIIAPCTLENMGKRKKVHHHIRFSQSL